MLLVTTFASDKRFEKDDPGQMKEDENTHSRRQKRG
jgi:hypothetical protein